MSKFKFIKDLIKVFGEHDNKETKTKKKKIYADCIIRNHNGDVLILQRSFQDDFQEGKWCLPGGKIDEGEFPNGAVVREVFEETGIDISAISGASIRFIKSIKKEDCIIYYYEAILPKEPIIILDNEEHYRYEFVPVERLDRYDFLLDLGDTLNSMVENNELSIMDVIDMQPEFTNALEEIAAAGHQTLHKAEEIKTAFDNGEIEDADFIKYLQINQALETITKGFDYGQVTEGQFFDALEKSKHYEFVKVNRDGKIFYQYREVGTDKIEEDVETGTELETSALLGLTIKKYSDKSFLITGDTFKNLNLLRKIKDELGGYGSFNKPLNGWIFPAFGKDKILAAMADKMTVETYNETVQKEAAIALKNAVDPGTEVTVDGETTKVEESDVDKNGEVNYIVDSEKHGQKVDTTETQVGIVPADENKAEELINNATEENRFRVGKELFGKEENEKPVSATIEAEGQKEIKIEPKEFTTRSGKVITAIDFSSIKHTDVQLINQDGILEKPKPYWIPDIDEKFFESNKYTLNHIKQDENNIIVQLNADKQFETMRKIYSFGGGVSKNQSADFAVVSLEQFVAIQDYYQKKKKAELHKENLEYLKKRAAEVSTWNQERIEHYKVFDYKRLSKEQQKKYSEEQWNNLPLDDKIKEIPYYKTQFFNGKSTRISVLKDNRIPNSYFRLYGELVNPNEPGLNGRFYNPKAQSVIEYNELRKNVEYKTNDLEVQKEENDNAYVKGRETSYGDSGTRNDLYDSLGVKIKTQNGKEMKPDQISDIKDHLSKVYQSFGDRSGMAKTYGLKISHAADTHMHASKAIGVYIPAYKAIGVGHAANSFGFTLSHEFAHFIDNYAGTKTQRWFASDDYNSLAGKIATTFRTKMNVKTENKYINRTCECFARALEQYHAIKTEGESALHHGTTPYYESPTLVNKENFETHIKPLIEQFLQENDHLLKSATDELKLMGVYDDRIILEELNNSFELIKSAFDNEEIDEQTFVEYAGKFNEISKGDPSHGGKLVKKTIVDKTGKKETKWISKEQADNEEKNKTPEPVTHSKNVLSAFAKETPLAELKRVINESTDEKLRAAAHAELDRRDKKEKPQEKKPVATSKKKDKSKPVKRESDKLAENKDVEEQIQPTIKGFYKPDVKMDANDIASLSGMKGKFGKFIIKEFKDFINVEVENSDGEIDFNIKNDKTLSIRFVKVNKTGNGLGTDILNNQIKAAKKLGYNTITLAAYREGDDGNQYNGYYTFARLGFEMYKENELKELKEKFNVNSLQELMSTERGKKEWKMFGFNFSGKLNIT